ncbi:602_t:CDS:2 [Funneliformis mosseae]|uniref:602_t:CDS:1 n=1 Tax=Funneliformis mosseae TaxID=27381 RepID=A0A9N9H2Y1_FUNMO|nr:602_t:CDS:2 [Funneliformis mosseae]
MSWKVQETNNNEANKLSLWKFEIPFKKDNKLKILNEKFRNDIDIEQELGEDESPIELNRRFFRLVIDFWNDPKAKTVLNSDGVTKLTSYQDHYPRFNNKFLRLCKSPDGKFGTSTQDIYNKEIMFAND